MGALLRGIVLGWTALAALAFASPIYASSHRAFTNPVIVIPGVMGSRLERGGRVLWGESIWKMKDRFEELALPADLSDDGVRATDVLRDLRVVGGLFKLKEYSELLDHLRAAGLKDGETLFVFPYDWRRSNAESAQRLREQVEKWRAALPRPDVKFRIVAHSMGGLVAKYYVNQLGGDRRVDRLILLGTPTGGSLKSVMMFSGGLMDDTLNNFLGVERVRRVLRTFPASYELLPRVRSCCLEKAADGKETALNLFTVAPWQRFGWIEFSPAEQAAGWKFVEARLRGAQDFHHALHGVGGKVTIHKVVGYTQQTLGQLVMEPAGSGFKLAQRMVPGDGTVTVDSARIGDFAYADAQDNVQRVPEKHGALYVDDAARATILDLVRNAPRFAKEERYSTALSSVGQLDVTLDRNFLKGGEQATVLIDARDGQGHPIAAESVALRVNGQAVAAVRIESGARTSLAYRFAAPAASGTYEVHVSVALKDLPALRVTEMFEVIE